MLNLKDITLISVDCVDLKRIQLAADICNYYVKPYDTKILTSIIPNDKKYNYVNIEPITNIHQYSNFIIKELYKYIETDFIIIFQYDGFILNPNAWTDEYYNYDYIGAPWLLYEKNKDVGNGGFSLRSKKLQDFLVDDRIIIGPPEDAVICHYYSDLLRENGFNFAPVEIASKFSVENREWDNQFGFHSFKGTNTNKWKDKNKFFGE